MPASSSLCAARKLLKKVVTPSQSAPMIQASRVPFPKPVKPDTA